MHKLGMAALLAVAGSFAIAASANAEAQSYGSYIIR